MAHAVADGARTFTATVVAVCRPERLQETQAALRALHTRSAVRPIIITLGEHPQPPLTEEEGETLIEGLTPRYLNNVVAARRLSSLPALAWWRGGDSNVLAGLAVLVDRILLDSANPLEDWRAATPLVELTAFGDLRWTRLTRWRNLMAQFFDVPDVRAAAGDFSRLEIAAADEHAAALFAGWISSRLPIGRALDVRVALPDDAQFVSSIALSGSTHRLELRLTPSGTCVQTSIDGGTQPTGTRTVSLGNQTLVALLAEELRMRARDISFEQALRCAAGAA